MIPNFIIFIAQDVVIVCFSLNNEDSFENASSIWCPEAKILSPKSPIILVGTKKDLPQKSFSKSYDMDAVVRRITGANYYLEITANDKGKQQQNKTRNKVVFPTFLVSF